MEAAPRLFVIGDDFAGSLREAMEVAGKHLASRARSEREVRDKLRGADFDEDVIEQTVVRLTELGLLDDLAFATAWIEERSARRSLGPRALKAELAAKGISREVADQALEAQGRDEEALATEAAERHLRKVARYPLQEQYGRLVQALLRRGFSAEAAGAGARAVLPPEGWD
jgi:regulatory protein